MSTIKVAVPAFAWLSVAVALMWTSSVRGQAGPSRSPSPFAPLALAPAPSATRLANGTPGPTYWQNRADYYLRATLDTATHSVTGSLALRYTNNSPHTLDVLWIQTEQDPHERIERFVQRVQGAFVPVQLENHDTETKVTLAEPIKPGATAQFQVAWQFVLVSRRGTQARMGWDGPRYEIAQWYPRVNVYDDVKGWNTEPYTIDPDPEFYLEYGDYVMEVTVPAGYVVAATGMLDNPKEVLTSTELARLAAAATADTVVPIVTAAELKNGAARPTRDGLLTWKFHAKNVRDAVWCASPYYQWDAANWHGILAQAYYGPGDASAWREGADMARMSIREYSERWFPYPYPQISAVAGVAPGMEYPMLSMVLGPSLPLGGTTPAFLYDVLTHEVGHNWFPMLVGSNERVHPWMDEGFNTFINTFSNARRYPQGGDQNARGQYYVRWIERQAKGGEDRPLETGAVIGNAGAQYFKTAGVLQMLRRDVMGPALFDKGLQTYIRRWAYKHPTPADFFRTMNDVAGRNLDWFWREWFYEAPKFDQSLDTVTVTPQGTEPRVRVVYGNKQAGVMPVLVRFTFSDSTTRDFAYPATVWQGGPTYTVAYTFGRKMVTKIVLDPDAHLVDVDRANNSWVAQ